MATTIDITTLIGLVIMWVYVDYILFGDTICIVSKVYDFFNNCNDVKK